MTEIDDPFISCLYDAPGVALWQHDGEPGGSRYVLDVAQGDWPAERLAAALALIPPGGLVRVISD